MPPMWIVSEPGINHVVMSGRMRDLVIMVSVRHVIDMGRRVRYVIDVIARIIGPLQIERKVRRRQKSCAW